MNFISIVTPCHNEQDNIEVLYRSVKDIFKQLPQYQYEHIFIDNASSDNTASVLKKMARDDCHVKVIINTRNFGHIRSPHHALLQAQGDAVISLVADLQDPPHLIHEFISKWAQGYKIVIGVKSSSEESSMIFAIRRLGYYLIGRLAEVELIKNFSGFGLYDKEVITILRTYNDPYPYFRGMIADVGFDIAKILYHQPKRGKGQTKNNYYTLYDIGMLGITNYSKIPLRCAAIGGLLLTATFAMLAIVTVIFKLIYWDTLNIEMAAIMMSIGFFSSVQLFFIGLVGEYICSINTRVMKRPLVVEKERVNF